MRTEKVKKIIQKDAKNTINKTMKSNKRSNINIISNNNNNTINTSRSNLKFNIRRQRNNNTSWESKRSPWNSSNKRRYTISNTR